MARTAPEIRFQVTNRGIGIFDNLIQTRGLATEIGAIQDLLKGKQTLPRKLKRRGHFLHLQGRRPDVHPAQYLEWDVIESDRFLFMEGLRWKERHGLSYWDALILAADSKSKAKEVWGKI